MAQENLLSALLKLSGFGAHAHVDYDVTSIALPTTLGYEDLLQDSQDEQFDYESTHLLLCHQA